MDAKAKAEVEAKAEAKAEADASPAPASPVSPAPLLSPCGGGLGLGLVQETLQPSLYAGWPWTSAQASARQSGGVRFVQLKLFGVTSASA
jgi:hypothetical protein